MNTFAKTIIATGVAALFAWVFMAVILKDTEPDALNYYFVIAAMCGTAISTFMSFQRLAKIRGAFGHVGIGSGFARAVQIAFRGDWAMSQGSIVKVQAGAMIE